ncbi:unnamed protein product [Wuchereria bancrofti]|uniref:Heme-copper oxidase subunit III family profile domain-containing protein n=1 Tax=Wuchereria bancrofti TaxID=6293 RepID=A0A3P7E5N7_WUCBA|nr:unnamed protein product [Wuchereria bancrofti]
MEFSYYPIMFGLGVLGIDDVFLEDVSGQYSFYDYRIFNQGFRLFLFSELTLFFFYFLDISGLFFVSFNLVLKYSCRYLCLNINKCENLLLLLCIFIGGFFFFVFSYSDHCFVMNDRIYGRVFYIGTGLHGSHHMICLLIIDVFWNGCEELYFVYYMFEVFNFSL